MGLLTLQGIQEKLKGTGVNLSQRGNKLYLVAVLPDANGGKDKQQRISLGISPNTQQELRRAEAEAYRLISERLSGFNWESWRNQKTSVDTIYQGIEKYREVRKATVSEKRINDEYKHTLRKLPGDKFPTYKNLTELLATTPRNSAIRLRHYQTIARLIKINDWDIDISQYKSAYGNAKVKKRILPGAQEIIEKSKRFLLPEHCRKRKQKEYQWIYRMIATYGLRPHETMFATVSKEYPHECKITEGKTGERTVYPYPPEWAIKWQLWEKYTPKFKTKDHVEIGERIGEALRKYDIDNIYNERHAYSLRAHLQYNLPPRAVAKLMGHSVEVWLKTYSRWLEDAQTLELYMRSLDNKKPLD